jgi:hypothetical protein
MKLFNPNTNVGEASTIIEDQCTTLSGPASTVVMHHHDIAPTSRPIGMISPSTSSAVSHPELVSTVTTLGDCISETKQNHNKHHHQHRNPIMNSSAMTSSNRNATNET